MSTPADKVEPLAPLCRFCEGWGRLPNLYGVGTSQERCENCDALGRTWYYECDHCRKTLDIRESPIASGDGPLCAPCNREVLIAETNFAELVAVLDEAQDTLTDYSQHETAGRVASVSAKLAVLAEAFGQVEK